MSKNKIKTTFIEKNKAAESVTPAPASDAWFLNTLRNSWLLFAFACLLYANTLFNDFTQDDAIVITDNMFTAKGLSGASGILGYDTFYGFFKEAGKANLVAGGRYRPFTLLMFAAEWQFFGKNPLVGHLINVLLFGLICVLIYRLFLRLLKQKMPPEAAAFVAFSTALLFAAHPIHTEAVANIKGRDEIVSLLGSLAAVWFSFRYFDTKNFLSQIGVFIAFFIALLSKENTITFLAVAPLMYYFFTDASFGRTARLMLPFVAATVLFLALRGAVIGWQMGDAPLELMNNPFLKLEAGRYVPFSAGEKLATIFFTLGKYVQLLVFPHPLTHDYYPRHVGIMNWGDWQVLLSVLLYAAMIFFAVKKFREKNIISFGILFFLATLSIVSNLVFPIGTNMSERFVFMPSVGFCFAAAAGLYFISKKINTRSATLIGGAVCLLFGVKTVARNTVWKDNFTLFTTDVNTSANSAKLCNAAAGELDRVAAYEEKNEAKKTAMFQRAIGYLNHAIEIHPTYKNAYLLMGNTNFHLKNYDKAVESYQSALKIDPNYRDAKNNLGIAFRDLGKQYGEQRGDVVRALEYLNQAVVLRPDDVEVLRLLGVANGVQGNHAKAIDFFTKVLAQQPNNAQATFDLGTAYYQAGDRAKSDELHAKATQMGLEIKK